MISSLITLLFFLLGCVAGALDWIDFDAHQVSVYVLYFLMLILGINIGCNRDPKELKATFKPQNLLIPLATIIGTLIFSAIGAFFLSQWTVYDCMAVGSGLSYYSVSSILITELKSASLGVQVATELGTIALLANIFREMTALIGAPIFRRYFGYFAPISAAGIASADVSLSAIARYSGKDAIPLAVIHGVLIELCVPFFVSIFCKM